MTTRAFRVFFATALGALIAFAAVRAAGPALVVTHVRIFDGQSVIPDGTVVVEGGTIRTVAKAGAKVAMPAGAQVVDGTGATLIPGLIDGHTHAFGDALARALAFGVTTELDMFTATDFARQMRAEQAAGGASGRADLRSAGTLATAPGGHGTEYGFAIPTLTKPEEAQGWVDARIAEGSDYIKIVSEDGTPYGMNVPTLDRATIAALIAAAHKRGKLAVVHISTERDAETALLDGADGLVHIFTDRAPEPAFVAAAKKGKGFVTPTLTVVESTTGAKGGKALADDPRINPYLTQEEIDGLSGSFPMHGKLDFANALVAVRQLHDASVPILAGTDAPNPGTTHGASLHRELELLVQAGLTPVEALAAATSAPAKAFHLGDRGRIAPGLRADLVLIAGNPTTKITDSRAILRVWKGGVEAPRKKVERTASNLAPKPPAAAQGKISDFENGATTTGFGMGWIVSTDQMAGGKSEVAMAVVDGGNGSGKALELKGEVRTGFGFPWAGALYSPGAMMMAAADLSEYAGLEFAVQGDGRPAQILLFAKHLGRMPAVKSFPTTTGWTTVRVSWKELNLDGTDLIGIFVGSGAPVGPFSLKIDDVRLYKE